MSETVPRGFDLAQAALDLQKKVLPWLLDDGIDYRAKPTLGGAGEHTVARADRPSVTVDATILQREEVGTKKEQGTHTKVIVSEPEGRTFIVEVRNGELSAVREVNGSNQEVVYGQETIRYLHDQITATSVTRRAKLARFGVKIAGRVTRMVQ